MFPKVGAGAHYVCHLAMSDPEGQVLAEFEAQCHGRVGFAAAGSAGFGYDPLFEIIEYRRTFAQLGEHVKSLISHRGRAIRTFIPHIVRCLGSG